MSSRIPARLALAAALLVPSYVMAHVTIRPAEAPSGETVTYSVRVPSEGEVATTSVELEIPAGLTVVSVEGEAGSYELKKDGARTTAIAWKTNVPPGERTELKFLAKNPATGAELTWKAHQRFQDGSQADWVEPKGSKRPASVTVLKAAP